MYEEETHQEMRYR